MATAPNLVVAGDPGVARKLRETGRFPAVYDAASAAELRDLSKSGRVGSPAAFMFAPGFVEDLPAVGVAVLANGLAGSGFTVLVHGFFAERGDTFDPKVQVTGRQLRLSELLANLGATEPAPAAPPTAARPPAPEQPPAAAPAAAPAQPPAPAGNTRPPAQAPVQAQAPAAPPQHPTQHAPAQHAAPAQHPQAAQYPAAGQHPAPGQYPAAPQQPVPATDQRAWPVHQPQQQPWQGQHPEAGQESGSATRHDHDSLPVPASSSGWPARQPALPAPEAPAPVAPAKRGRVIAVSAAKGGVGKTSTAVNLSVYAARHLHAAGRPGSVVLVDTNFQQADVARYLNLETPTVLDMLNLNGALSAETVRDYLAYSPDTDLHALLGPPDVVKADPSLINSVLYRRIIAVLRRAFDFVFVDTPVAELYHTTFTDLILPEADAILVPVEPNRVTLEAARSWLRAITMPQHSRSGGVDPEKLSLILNRARADVDCSPEDVMDLLPGWRFVGMIPEDQGWTQAANNRRLNDLQTGPGLEATFREILHSVTGDPVFDTEVKLASSNGRGGMLKKILGLNHK